jgi:hypothetical protein
VRNGEEEITERIEKAGKFYKPVKATLLKWEMSKAGNMLFKSTIQTCSRNMDMT